MLRLPGEERPTPWRDRGWEQDPFAKTLRRSRYAPRTARLYVGTIRALEAWLTEHRKTRLRSATVEDIIDFTEATTPFTYASRQRLINAYKAYWRLHLGKKEGTCPAESIRCPGRPKQSYRGLDEIKDALRLVDVAKQIGVQAHACCALCYFTALRCSEVAGLRRSNDEGRWLDVMGKGAQPRRVPVHPTLREALDGVCELTEGQDSPWVFPGRYPGTHISPNTVNIWVKLAGQRAGLGNVTPHMLRYTSGAVMLDATGDLRATGEYLGHSHSSLAITAGYTRTRAAKLLELMDQLGPSTPS